MGSNTIVTIGRQFCSKGNEIGQALSVRLGIPYYDDFILEKAAADHGIPVAYAEHYDEKPASPFEQSVAMASFFYSTAETMATTQEQLSQAQRRTILELAEQGPCIIVGRCANFILRGRDNVLNVFVTAPVVDCVRRVMETDGLNLEEAEKKIKKIDKRRADYFKYFTGRQWQDAALYDLCLNTGHMSEQTCVDIVKAYMNARFE